MRHHLRFWFVELVLIGMFFGFSYIGDWWRNGDRITGVILEIEEPDADCCRWATIRDPATGSDISFEFSSAAEVGDTATAVVMRDDRSKVASPGALQVYLGLWAVLGLAAVAWPLFCLRCYGRLALPVTAVTTASATHLVTDALRRRLDAEEDGVGSLPSERFDEVSDGPIDRAPSRR